MSSGFMNNPNNIPNNGLVYSPIQQPASSSMLNTDTEMEGVTMAESTALPYQQQQPHSNQPQSQNELAAASQQHQNAQLNYSIEHPLGTEIFFTEHISLNENIQTLFSYLVT